MLTSGNPIILRFHFPCSITVLYDWLTQPTQLQKWVNISSYEMLTVFTNPQKGGTFSIKLINQSGRTLFIDGMYLEADPPRILAFTMDYYGISTAPPKSVVYIELQEINPLETELNFTQDFALNPSHINWQVHEWKRMFLRLGQVINPYEQLDEFRF